MRRSTRAMVLFVHTQILLFWSDFFPSVSNYSSKLAKVGNTAPVSIT